MKRFFARLFIVGVLALATGCASPPSPAPSPSVSEDRLAIAPTDFAVDVTVLAPKVVPPSSGATPLQRRFVLFANGSLHYASDAEHTNSHDWLPPLSRILTRQQMTQIWSLTNQLGFTREMALGHVANFKLVEPVASDQVAFLAGFVADGRRWTIERRTPLDQPDPAMNELVNVLAQLAWANDSICGPVRMQPIRYDFGPDPYARYRSEGTAP